MADAFAAMIEYLQGSADVAGRVAAGELTMNVEPRSPLDGLGNAFSRMVVQLRAVVGSMASFAPDAVGRLAGDGHDVGGGRARGHGDRERGRRGRHRRRAPGPRGRAGPPRRRARRVGERPRRPQRARDRRAAISAATQQTSASAQQIAASAQQLARMAEELDGLVGQFTLA